jgi:hypothetical protein
MGLAMVRRRNASRLCLRPLEERALPTTFTVMNTNDAGPGSLRQAVLDANSPAYPGADTIVFDPSLVSSSDGTISLTTFDAGLDSAGAGPSALLITSPITITGPSGDHGITITRSASASNFRLFHVRTGGNLTLEYLTLGGGVAAGFNGGGNGGGAAGMGGAIADLKGASIAMDSSILFGDTAATGSEIFTVGTATVNTSLIQSTSGVSTFNGDAFTNSHIGVNPMLGPLANNGGTKTHAISNGSPAIDNGSNPAGLMFDQRGNTRVVGPAADIGAYEVQAPAKFSSVVINGGAAQRSMVTQVTVNFNQHIGFSAVSAAFALNRVGDAASVNLAASVDDSGPGTAVTLTFTGGAVNGASLADGRYALTILASGFIAEGFDGNGNGIAEGSPADDFYYAEPFSSFPLDTTKIFRIYGDINGDGTVSASDFIVFRQFFGGSNFAFDFDGDGSVATSDFLQFRLRFGGSI